MARNLIAGNLKAGWRIARNRKAGWRMARNLIAGWGIARRGKAGLAGSARIARRGIAIAGRRIWARGTIGRWDHRRGSSARLLMAPILSVRVSFLNVSRTLLESGG